MTKKDNVLDHYHAQQLWNDHEKLRLAGEALQGLGEIVNTDSVGICIEKSPDSNIVHAHLGIAIHALGNYILDLQASLQRKTLNLMESQENGRESHTGMTDA